MSTGYWMLKCWSWSRDCWPKRWLKAAAGPAHLVEHPVEHDAALFVLVEAL
ncbi:MAG: hypothetical protein R2708_26765 [Vicinamibacterales bacterium]